MKFITLRPLQEILEIRIVYRHFNLSNLSDKKWFLRGTNQVFTRNEHILAQLKNIRPGNYIFDTHGEKMYQAIFVGECC